MRLPKILGKAVVFLGMAIGLCLLIVQLQTNSVALPAHSEIIQQLKEADIVYLGERHDNSQDHQAQLEIITELYQANPEIAIAMEMFQRPYQPVLDRYLAGEIDEAQLRQDSEYDERWGFDWEYYAPMLRFAQAHNLDVLALNTPSEITRQVAREGLTSLDEEQKRYIPPLDEIRTDNAEYRQAVQEVYQMHAHGNLGNSDGFENFFAAQVLWDETMAEKIAEFYRNHRDHQVVVIAGQAHIVNGYGIPDRVARRLDDIPFEARSLIFAEETNTAEGVDFVWQHQS